MQRRTLVIGGALTAGAAIGGIGLAPARGQAIAARSFDWKGADFLSGGTSGVPNDLPEPVFRAEPNCVTTGCKTLGPCHMDGPAERYDISEGFAGLPTRLSLKIVDAADCRPIKNAIVDIWHTNAGGFYTGEDTVRMCTLDNPEATASTAFRGWQRTDGEGRVDFLTVYPGWYRGRTVHIHLRVIVGEEELLVSQLLFDDTLSDIVFASHPDYAGRPERGTTNANDGVFRPSEVEAYIFDVEKIGGVLQASFTIGVDRFSACAGGPA